MWRWKFCYFRDERNFQSPLGVRGRAEISRGDTRILMKISGNMLLTLARVKPTADLGYNPHIPWNYHQNRIIIVKVMPLPRKWWQTDIHTQTDTERNVLRKVWNPKCVWKCWFGRPNFFHLLKLITRLPLLCRLGSNNRISIRAYCACCVVALMSQNVVVSLETLLTIK